MYFCELHMEIVSAYFIYFYNYNYVNFSAERKLVSTE